jgi:hypothetical protein
MDKQQWNGFGVLAAVMHGMYIQLTEPIYTHSNTDMLELLIQSVFLRTPVKAVTPNSDKSLDFIEGNTHIPARGIELIGKGCVFQLPVELLELLVWDSDRVWGHERHSVKSEVEVGRDIQDWFSYNCST